MPYESGCPNPVWDGSSCPIHDWSPIQSTEFPRAWHGLHYEIYVETTAYMGRRDIFWMGHELGIYIHIGIMPLWLRAVRHR